MLAVRRQHGAITSQSAGIPFGAGLPELEELSRQSTGAAGKRATREQQGQHKAARGMCSAETQSRSSRMSLLSSPSPESLRKRRAMQSPCSAPYTLGGRDSRVEGSQRQPWDGTDSQAGIIQGGARTSLPWRWTALSQSCLD